VIEGLLPPAHNKIISDLLFELLVWHAYAKLRLHTDKTLLQFENSTRTLGAALRRFLRTTCRFYVTKELPKEEAARGRRKAALAAKEAAKGTSKGPGISEAKGKGKAGPHRKYLNLATYKLHSLGDYVNTIRQFGPTDNYTTQVVSFLILNRFNIQIYS
jgi:hypothetical protein